MSYRTLGFPEYGMTHAINVKRVFTPDSNPKRGNTKMVNKIDINLCKSRKPKQNSVIAYLIVFSEYVMTNASISSVVLPQIATPKGVTKLAFIYVKEPKLKSLT